jgi:hypothetical protein
MFDSRQYKVRFFISHGVEPGPLWHLATYTVGTEDCYCGSKLFVSWSLPPLPSSVWHETSHRHLIRADMMFALNTRSSSLLLLVIYYSAFNGSTFEYASIPSIGWIIKRLMDLQVCTRQGLWVNSEEFTSRTRATPRKISTSISNFQVWTQIFVMRRRISNLSAGNVPLLLIFM